jgi:hypothetical protein
MTDMSTAEIKDAFDLPINATALGYYVNVSAITGCVFSVQIILTFLFLATQPVIVCRMRHLAKEPAAFEKYIQTVKSVAPPALPIIICE